MLRTIASRMRPLALTAGRTAAASEPAWMRLAAREPMARTLCSLGAPETIKGRVKWFDAEKGYGFILPDNEDIPDVFVHHTGIVSQGFRKLDPEQLVEFQLITDDSGRSKAVEVTGPDGEEIVAEDNFNQRDGGNDGYY